MNNAIRTVIRAKKQKFSFGAIMSVLLLVLFGAVNKLAQGLDDIDLSIDANEWSISMRGNAARFNRLLLVQMDGRTLYNPLFSGVYWSNPDYVLDDLSQIEVIRGPGASLWGSNAVNGIINILSKSAKDTQGFLFKMHMGTEEQGYGTIRHGGQLDENTFYRVYTKFTKHDDFDTFVRWSSAGTKAMHPASEPNEYDDKWRRNTGGFRIDWDKPGQDSYTLSGDMFSAADGEYFSYGAYDAVYAANNSAAYPNGAPPLSTRDMKKTSGWNLNAKWEHTISENNKLELRTYFDQLDMDYVMVGLRTISGIFDVDFQHNFLLRKRHKIVWGFGYRQTRMDIDDSPAVSFSDINSNKNTLAAFMQDTIPLVRDKLDFTIGFKSEYNDYTGSEFQPNARLAWKPADNKVVWGAVSRAVRIPAIMHDNISAILMTVPLPVDLNGDDIPDISMPLPIRMHGNTDLEPEELTSYELGYRVTPNNRFSIDVTSFVNRGRNMNYYHQAYSTPASALEGFDKEISSDGIHNSWGFEITSNWLVSDKWKLTGSYSYIDFDYSGGTEPSYPATSDNMAQIRSYYDINDNWELNNSFFYRDNVNHPSSRVDANIRVDMGITLKHPNEKFQMRLWGQGLMDPKYQEDQPDNFASRAMAEVERGVYLELRWEL